MYTPVPDWFWPAVWDVAKLAIPHTTEQWYAFWAWTLLHYALGKNQDIRPNSVLEVVEVLVQTLYKRLRRKP